MLGTHEEIILELARFQREALDRVRRRMSEQQLGEAWVGLDTLAESSNYLGIEPGHR